MFFLVRFFGLAKKGFVQLVLITVACKMHEKDEKLNCLVLQDKDVLEYVLLKVS